jgi:hypothetical protein
VDTERVCRMPEKPEFFLKSALARRLHTDPRVCGLRDAQPIPFLVTASGRKLELFTVLKTELQPTKKNQDA